MRIVLTLLLLLVLNATNLAVAADVHPYPAQAVDLAGQSASSDADGGEPAQPPCQICLHGAALTLLPQGVSILPARHFALLPLAADCPTPPAAPPGRIDKPPRSVSG